MIAITCPSDVWSTLTWENRLHSFPHNRSYAPQTSRMFARLKQWKARSNSYDSENPQLRGLIAETRMGRAREGERQSARRPHPMMPHSWSFQAGLIKERTLERLLVAPFNGHWRLFCNGHFHPSFNGCLCSFNIWGSSFQRSFAPPGSFDVFICSTLSTVVCEHPEAQCQRALDTSLRSRCWFLALSLLWFLLHKLSSQVKSRGCMWAGGAKLINRTETKLHYRHICSDLTLRLSLHIFFAWSYHIQCRLMDRNLQVMPQIFNWISVRDLTGPLKDIFIFVP